LQETLFRCSFKCWKNGEFRTIRPTYVALYYDTDLNWIVAKQGKSAKSSYKLSNITDVRISTWGAFVRHISVVVWVTDDDGNKFKFDYDGSEAIKVYERIKGLAETSSPYFKALPGIVVLLNRNERVLLDEVLGLLPKQGRQWSREEAKELVEHLVEVGDVSGSVEGGFFVRGVPPDENAPGEKG